MERRKYKLISTNLRVRLEDGKLEQRISAEPYKITLYCSKFGRIAIREYGEHIEVYGIYSGFGGFEYNAFPEYCFRYDSNDDEILKISEEKCAKRRIKLEEDDFTDERIFNIRHCYWIKPIHNEKTRKEIERVMREKHKITKEIRFYDVV